jgi:hypothetical protein
MRRKWVFLAPLGILAIALFIAAGGEVVRLLWNWLLPPIFGWREITFWQAIGMLALARSYARGAGTVPASHTPTLRLPPSRERDRGPSGRTAGAPRNVTGVPWPAPFAVVSSCAIRSAGGRTR